MTCWLLSLTLNTWPDRTSRLVKMQRWGISLQLHYLWGCRAAETLSHFDLRWLWAPQSIFLFAGSKVVKMESCRKRYHSVSNHSIKPGHAVCVCGASEVVGDPQTSSVTLCANEWTMAIHQSSMPACLVAWNQLQCPSQGNLIPSADSFISLDLICNPGRFPKERRVGLQEANGFKILNLRGTNDQWSKILLGAQ